MKRILFIMAVIPAIISCSGKEKTCDVTEFGAKGDGITDCTAAFERAVAECGTEGGTIIVPAGKYLCRTVHLKSGIELHLEKDAVIVGCENPEAYDSFIPVNDLSRYDSGDGTVNSNNSRDSRWNRALIMAEGVNDVAITGEGTIDGRHVFDPLGEEYMRGPHTILFAESTGIRLEGITIIRAANYAFMGYALSDASFKNVTIREGWDGIHIRGGRNVEISHCTFETGDDSIAGGYWEAMRIHDCNINSSCNGLRLMMPGEDVKISDCLFHGPGVYPHRTSGEARRNNMLFGINIQPGAWGRSPGKLNGIVIENNKMSAVSSPIGINVQPEVEAGDLTIRNVHSTGVYGTLDLAVCYNDCGFRKISVTDCTISR